MVGVIVGHDDVLHAPPRHDAVEMPLPERPRGFHAEAAVDQREAVAVGEDPQVDVVERERQRHANPPDAVADAERFPGLRDALAEGMPYLVLNAPTPFQVGPGGLYLKSYMR